MGIRFSYFSMVVIWQSAGAYSLISNAEKPIAVPTSRMLFGFVYVSKNFNRLCIDLRMIGTCVSSAYFSISFSHAGFPLSRESINADILSSMIIILPVSIVRFYCPFLLCNGFQRLCLAGQCAAVIYGLNGFFFRTFRLSSHDFHHFLCGHSSTQFISSGLPVLLILR